MLKIAIVEDDDVFSAQLAAFVERYGAEKRRPSSVDRFPNAARFLDAACAGYDIVFFDIQMPYLNGMDAAARLRRTDGAVTIVFITSLAQYAVDGYGVGAADFILKPLDYDEFFLKFTRLLRHLKPRPEGSLMVQTQGGLVKLQLREIRYVESRGHNAVYHLAGEEVARRASLTQAEQELGEGFVRCNSCYLVNLCHVQSVRGHTALVDGVELSISQPRRKQFVRRWREFTGGTP